MKRGFHPVRYFVREASVSIFGWQVSVNISRHKEQHESNAGRRDGSISRFRLTGYFILTLAIIWSAALVPSWADPSLGKVTSANVLIPPSLLTLFFLIPAIVILRSGKDLWR